MGKLEGKIAIVTGSGKEIKHETEIDIADEGEIILKVASNITGIRLLMDINVV